MRYLRACIRLRIVVTALKADKVHLNKSADLRPEWAD